MSDKLSPKDFDSITEWAKQYIVGGIKGTLLNPVIAVKSNDYNQLIYTVNNPNEVEAYFNGELISAKGQSELTHIWNESTFTISGKLSAKNWNSSEVVSLKVERAPKLYNITVSATTNGTITCNKTQASAGDVITITCSANSGYALETLTVNGTSIYVSGTTTYTYTMKEEDVTIRGEFKIAKLENDVSWYDYQKTGFWFTTLKVSNKNSVSAKVNLRLYNDDFELCGTTNATISSNGEYTFTNLATYRAVYVYANFSAEGFTKSDDVSLSIYN